MRLLELNPRWLSYQNQVLGLSFDCPHCISQRLAVAFHHSGREQIDDFHILANAPSTNHIWTVATTVKDDFETLTLSPSIDCSSSGHWHGFIENGNIK